MVTNLWPKPSDKFKFWGCMALLAIYTLPSILPGLFLFLANITPKRRVR